MLKKLAALASGCVIFAANSIVFAESLKTYDQITDALGNGKMVMINIDVSKCKVESDSVYTTKRLAVRFVDLYEFESTLNPGNQGTRMSAVASLITGLSGNKKLNWTRELVLVFQDGTVVVADDQVDPATFNLTSRALIRCKLSDDNSGGAAAQSVS